jgi:hypothetical protein
LSTRAAAVGDVARWLNFVIALATKNGLTISLKIAEGQPVSLAIGIDGGPTMFTSTPAS